MTYTYEPHLNIRRGWRFLDDSPCWVVRSSHSHYGHLMVLDSWAEAMAWAEAYLQERAGS